MASAAARRSPRTRVRSAASMATSVPVPMARPRSAWASAAASLTPSPTIATTRPSACSRSTTSTLSGGQHLGDHLVDADLGGDRRGDGRVVAGEQHRAQPERAQPRDRLGAGRLDRVGDDEHAAGGAVPADGDRGAARPPRPRPGARVELGGQRRRPTRRAAGARPTSTAWPSTTPCDAEALRGWRSPRPRAASPTRSRGAGGDRPAAIGCSEASSSAPASRSSSASVRRRRRGDDVDQASSGRW